MLPFSRGGRLLGQAELLLLRTNETQFLLNFELAGGKLVLERAEIGLRDFRRLLDCLGELAQLGLSAGARLLLPFDPALEGVRQSGHC